MNSFEHKELIQFRTVKKRPVLRIYMAAAAIGFIIGFAVSFLSYSDSVIYHPDVHFYEVDETEESGMHVVENPYQTIQISDSEYEELRWVIALESGNSFDDKKAVCETVFNRCLSPKDWGQRSEGGPVHGVLSKKGQFSTYRYIGSGRAWATPGETEDDAISEVLRNGLTVLPSYKYVYFDSLGGVNGSRHIKIRGGNTYGAER